MAAETHHPSGEQIKADLATLLDIVETEEFGISALARVEAEIERLKGFIESDNWIKKSDHEEVLARLTQEQYELELRVRRPNDQEKIDAWWKARSEVKIDGNSRAEYVLQRDAAWERAVAAERQLADATAIVRRFHEACWEHDGDLPDEIEASAAEALAFLGDTLVASAPEEPQP